MTTHFRGIRLLTIVAGIAGAGLYFVNFLALPILPSGMQVRQLDNSTAEVAAFLQHARTESVRRNAPVACRIDKRFGRTVLWLDWNINGRQVHPEGDGLALPSGLVVTQEGESRTSGVIAIFNPRGGMTFRSDRLASQALVLYVSRPGRSADLREVSVTSAGNFEATNPWRGMKPSTLAANNASGWKAGSSQEAVGSLQ